MAASRRAVIFDLYGTLVDAVIDEESASFWDAFARDLGGMGGRITGGELKSTYRDLIREEGAHKEEGFLLDGVFTNLLTRCGIPASKESRNAVGDAFRKRSLVSLDKKPYTDELLALLKKSGCLIGLLSNTEELVTRHDLEVLKLTDSFDSVILSSAFGVKKPDPTIFQEMLQRLAVTGDEAVFVGDTFDADMAGCLGAGIVGIFLTAGEPGLKAGIEADHRGHLVCAGFSTPEIIAALQEFGFNLALT
jgi:putative hydrolase of the HAD superfamily